MEYVYAAMMLHAAEKDINDDAVTAVLAAAGVDVDAARVKALVASLGGIDIAEAMTQAVAAPAAAAPAAAASAAADAAPLRRPRGRRRGRGWLRRPRLALRLIRHDRCRADPGPACVSLDGRSHAGPPRPSLEAAGHRALRSIR